MITFNEILLAGGVDASKVKMLKHSVKGVHILEVWRADRAQFEEYQRRQKVGFFDGVDYAACFLVSRAGDAVFGRLYRVDGWIPAGPEDRDPFTDEPNDGTRAIFA